MAVNDFTGFGLAVGSVFGQRSWVIDRLGRLSSVVHDATPWRPGVNEAKCDSLMGVIERALSVPTTMATITDALDPARENHLATCTCGFYAYFAKQHNNYASTLKGISVEGVIEGFGKTVLGDKGFRAEKARIVALTLPKPERDKAHWLTRKLHQLDYNAIIGPVALFLTIAGTIFGVGTASDGSPWSGLLFAATLLSGYVLTCAHRADFHYAPPRSQNRQKLFALVRRNYPDVKFYDTAAEMYAAHPLTPPPEEALDPTTDEFWTRKV